MRKLTCAAFLLAIACGDNDPADQPASSIDAEAWREAQALPPELRAALDSGNAAMRADQYGEARRHYARAVQAAPQEAAAWFGLSMAERRLGNTAAADSAMQRVRALSPGASLLHPDDSGAAPPHP